MAWRYSCQIVSLMDMYWRAGEILTTLFLWWDLPRINFHHHHSSSQSPTTMQVNIENITLSPHKWSGPDTQQPHEHEYVQIWMWAHVIRSPTYTHPLCLQRAESAGRDKDQGHATCCWVGDSKLGGQRLGKAAGQEWMLCMPNLWGQGGDVIHGVTGRCTNQWLPPT